MAPPVTVGDGDGNQVDRGRRDQADVVELLRRNPGADRSQIRDVCTRYGSANILDELRQESDVG